MKKFSFIKKNGSLFVTTIGLALQCNFSFSQNFNDIPKFSLVRPKFKANCNKPEWPKFSLRNGEDGALQIAVKVGVDGKATQTIIEFSSGFEDLDNAARDSLKRCLFDPGTVNGKPVPMLMSAIYFWVETGDGMYGPHWQKIIASAKAGNSDSIYTIAQLQMSETKTKSSGIELLSTAL